MIETPEDWWNELHENLEDLTSLVSSYHPGPTYSPSSSLEITAPAAELVRQECLVGLEESDLVGNFTKAVESKDHKALLRILNSTWFGVPESTGAWSLRGFGVLCDLCSEGWVFYEQ